MRKLTFLFVFAVGLTSCSSVKVTSDFDREANFAAYKTYAFTREAEEMKGVDDINRKRIMAAVSRELEAKGLTKSDQPDALVDLNVISQQKQSATATSTPMYGAGYRYGWGGGFSTTQINVNNYEEGTLFVDVIDAGKKQLVWQGRAVGTINRDATPQKREANINKAVKEIFTRYPPKK